MTKPKKKTYRVTAATGYGGKTQGEEFTAALDEAAEARAIARGSIEIVKASDTGKAGNDG